MTDLNKEREAFELFELNKRPCVTPASLFERFDSNDLGEDEQHYVGRYVDSYMQEKWELWQKAKAKVVLDTQQKLTDTYYLEGSDYVVDCPFEYDIEIDKGEVLELQKWQRTESTKVYFANIYEDEDNFEILQFASKAEAENAVAENLKMLEASESGAEG
ncbi:hypothetical protein [Acinetobacter baumannii]|uniref:hypothetical protein n=2 Tax=Acinetobacter baumannii TaxID=470 RepID=UPI0007075B17|nr:hypothetical protein [Acinetobacter baumannii]AYY88387.1 hypothetical protein EGM95_06210 [Acinetobacter baumannii]EKT9116249.1 hypothetical protein [Acinetobacter baumannii]KAF0629531.1 hypothetical protein AB71191_02720 [Acinetobacter baumannii]KAF0630088.1 hypothetical protein AB71189_01688 [Acinetobacter baumannii]KQK32709.1 hypothetical protein AQ483_19000 [Acinetobacter baumannii]